MKRYPILFSTPMIHAIRGGRKWQTRRIVRPPSCARVFERLSYPEQSHADNSFNWTGVRNEYLHWAYGGGDLKDDVLKARIECPYGEPGSELWVRETFGYVTSNGKRLVYRADGDPPSPLLGTPEENGVRTMKWTPSIFMRPAQSRITLRIQAIRAQRIHSISEEDARAEGVEPQPTCRGNFARLWDTINGKRGPWASNPWVWVLEFKRAA